ncbi:hypothetical protein MAR_034081 [Mya arenaria]|uniref:Uncharacterized protein n=1 Tax=Mya arenaria TaxID=6604 RepID=A0ABY7GDX6_MYAAR|nr:hypothetical protein MAR_034081 [Mya arenaria]
MFGKSTLSVTAGYRLVEAHLFKLDIEQHVQLTCGHEESQKKSSPISEIMTFLVMTIDIASDRLKEIRLIKWWLQKDKAHLIEG